MKTAKDQKKDYQKHLAKMVHSFFIQALDKEADEVNKLYESFCDNWTQTVEKVNQKFKEGKQDEPFTLEPNAWRDIFEKNGYRNIITRMLPPKEKAALLRIIYIVEGKTEKQRERRETYYKIIFIKVRLKYFFKSLFKQSPAPQI